MLISLQGWTPTDPFAMDCDDLLVTMRSNNKINLRLFDTLKIKGKKSI